MTGRLARRAPTTPATVPDLRSRFGGQSVRADRERCFLCVRAHFRATVTAVTLADVSIK